MFLELRWLVMEYSLSSKGGRPSHPAGVPVVVVARGWNIPGLFRDVEGARMSTNPSRVLSTTQLHTKVLMSKIQTQRAEAIAAAASDEDGEGFRIGTRTIKQKTLASWLKPLVNTSSVCHLQWSSCSSVWNMYVWTDVCRD